MHSSRDEIRSKVRHRLRVKLIPKGKIPVTLQKHDSTILEGNVFVAEGERILDVMNAEKPFLPFEVAEGKFLVINKSSIAHVEPSGQGWMSESESPLPSMPPTGPVGAVDRPRVAGGYRRSAA